MTLLCGAVVNQTALPETSLKLQGHLLWLTSVDFGDLIYLA